MQFHAPEATGVDKAEFPPEARCRMPWVWRRNRCLRIGNQQAAGHAQVHDPLQAGALPSSRSKTMCLPTRWTRSMSRPGSSFAINCGEDLKGSGFPLNQVVSMRSPQDAHRPRGRWFRPQAVRAWLIFCHCRRCLAATGRRYMIKSRNRLRVAISYAGAPDLSAIFPPHPCAGLKKFDQEAEPAGEECVTRN